MEEMYQKYCSMFSPAYLSGSSWYVGKSLTEYISKKNMAKDIVSCLLDIAKCAAIKAQCDNSNNYDNNNVKHNLEGDIGKNNAKDNVNDVENNSGINNVLDVD